MTSPEAVRAILADMRTASDDVDEAQGTSDYQVRLVALALIARHFLRECADELEAALRTPPAEPVTDTLKARDRR
jgi:hypothetical protein